MTNYKALLLATISLGSLTALEPAMAQVSAPAADISTIEEVIVTAQRRSERLQDVPVSVTALNAEALSSRGLNDTTQLTLAAPSLQLGKENSFTVRGIGTLAFAGTIDSSVAQAIDDVNIGRPLAGTPLFYDVAQVEVLNGPQGLLFGKNASAGLINVTSVRPKLGQFGGSVDFEGATRSRPGDDGLGGLLKAAVNLPVTENAALRLAGAYSSQDALTQHVGGKGAKYEDNVKQLGLRAHYLWNPSDALTIDAIGNYNQSRGISGYYDGTFRSIAAGSVNTGPLAADNVTPGNENLIAAADAPAFRDLDNGGVQATVGYRFANGVEVSNIAAWRYYKLHQQIDGDTTGQNAANKNENRTRYDQYSNELRATLPEGNRLTGQAGLFYFHSKIDTHLEIGGDNFFPPFLLPMFPFCVGATVAAGGPPNCSVSNDYFLGIDKDYTLTTDSYAAFGQATYAVTNTVKLIVGARVTRDEISIDLAQNQLYKYFAPFGIKAVYAQSTDNTDLSWRFGVQYAPTSRFMTYLTYARGYKGPGFNDVGTVVGADLAIRPETSHNLEAGFKSSWLDNRVTFNVSAFHTKFSDYQSQSFDPVLHTFVVSNAASLTSKGLEITLNARPARGLSINSSVTLLDSKFGDFAGVQCYPGQTTTGCSTTGAFNAKGARTPSSPKLTSTVQVMYERPISGDLSGFIEGNAYHRSSINFLVNQAPGAEVGSIDVLGASIGVRGGAWKASLFCKNCTNEITPTYIDLEAGDSIGGKASYVQQFGYNSVRTIGVQLGVDF